MRRDARKKKDPLLEIDALRGQHTEARKCAHPVEPHGPNARVAGGQGPPSPSRRGKTLKQRISIQADGASRAQAEERLEIYHQILSSAKEGVAIQDVRGRVIEQNAAHRDLLGYPDEEVLGKTPGYYLEGGTNKFGRMMDDLRQRGNYSGEARCRARSGKWVDVELSVSTIRDDGGKTVGYATFMRDVTEKKRADGALRESKERFAAFMKHSSVIAFMRDTKGRYTYVNRALEKYLGKPSAQVVGKTVFDIWPADIAKDLSAGDTCVLAMMQPVELYERTRLPGQEAREWLSIKFPFHNRKGNTFVGCVSIDVTERKNLEEQLRQSQKMEAVGRLAGGIAHDFNNLMTIIMGYCELLLGSLAIDANLRGKVEEIHKAGERAVVLTRQLLAFSRKQVLTLQVLNLNTVIENLRKMIERLIGEDIEFMTVPHSPLDLVKADAGQVEQIIMNLVVNARDAMPNGGKLTIETANVEFDEAYVQSHRPSLSGHYVMIAVSDTGMGMDREIQKQIFEPFFTTKEKGKGTGLGLATVYGIVKQSEGFIWVYSEPGIGTTFKVYLPRVLEKEESHMPRASEPDQLRGNETILVAEDEDSLRRLIRETLESYGYKVLEAANGRDALAASNRYRETIDLVVADVVMPQMSGRELAEEITVARPGVRVLYISGYSDEAIVHHGVLASGMAFVQKPFSPKDLARKVRQVLSQRSSPEP